MSFKIKTHLEWTTKNSIKYQYLTICRYIRLACESLGPRCDEKHGCRGPGRITARWWTENQPSQASKETGSITRFKQLVLSTTTARTSLNAFGPVLPRRTRSWRMRAFTKTMNKLITRSLLLGSCSSGWQGLTGIYLEKGLHYLDFSAHVVKLSKLWSTDATPAFQDNFEPLFRVHVHIHQDIFQSLLQIPPERKQAVKQVLEKICEGCLQVTRRQLADFLPGGKYHNIHDPELREKMLHSKTTNLLGEACFGDLNFSLFKRQHAS